MLHECSTRRWPITSSVSRYGLSKKTSLSCRLLDMLHAMNTSPMNFWTVPP